MKAAILCTLLVCAMGTNIRASMMSETPKSEAEDLVRQYVVEDGDLWMSFDQDQKGGLYEDEIQALFMDFAAKGQPITWEISYPEDYVSRFDANNNGMMDKTEVIKLLKWLARKLYFTPNISDWLTRDYNNMKVMVDELLLMNDQNGDGMMDKDETFKVIDELAFRYGHEEDRNPDISVYYEDYDFNSDGLLNQNEIAELMERFIRDIYYDKSQGEVKGDRVVTWDEMVQYVNTRINESR